MGLTAIRYLPKGARFILPGDGRSPLCLGYVTSEPDSAGRVAVILENVPGRMLRYRGRTIHTGGRQERLVAGDALVLRAHGQGAAGVAPPDLSTADPPIRESSKGRGENSDDDAEWDEPVGGGEGVGGNSTRTSEHAKRAGPLCLCGCGVRTRRKTSWFARGHALPYYKRLRGEYFRAGPVDPAVERALADGWGISLRELRKERRRWLAAALGRAKRPAWWGVKN